MDYRSSTIVGTMGTNGTKKNTGKLNTNAEDKIYDIAIDVETPTKDITINHHMHSDSTETRSPRTQTIAEKLWKG